MNKIILIGRLTRDPEIRYSQGDNQLAIARYCIAVDRPFKKDGEPNADFISCAAIGKNGEFAEKYLRQGMKIAIEGRWQTGSYTNRDGNKIYTNECLVERQEFVESKNSSQSQSKNTQSVPPKMPDDGFVLIPDGIDEELPFK